MHRRYVNHVQGGESKLEWVAFVSWSETFTFKVNILKYFLW
jgi:hypothetical protein